MNNKTESDILTLLESGYNLPALNPIALRLMEMASDDHSSARDLANLIGKDPSLSVRVLKLANSAFYRTLEPVSTLDSAVVKIGFNRLRIMALSISLRDTFPMGKTGPIDYEQFWKTSLYRGLTAKSIADRMGNCNPAEAFLASFILEIGLLIFVDLFLKGSVREDFPGMDSSDDILEWERKTFGLDHRRIGEAALEYWKFPGPIIQCQQASTDRSARTQTGALIGICEMAAVLSKILSHGADSFESPYFIAQESFGLDQDTINDILVSVFQQVEAIASSLRVDVDRERDLLSIIEKAHAALSRVSERIPENRFSSTERKPPPSFESIGGTDMSARDILQAAAHEIRNPLTVVGGFARKLAAAMDPDSPEGKYADIILKEALRLEHALSEMTSGSGGAAGRIKV